MINISSMTGYCGSDPEVFLRRISDGAIVTSLEVFPTERDLPENWFRDGVQLELHQPIWNCRANSARALRTDLVALRQHLLPRGYDVAFDQTVELTPEVFYQLPPEERVLGCNPSLNIYNLHGNVERGPDFRERSAGGHMHFDLLATYLKEESDWYRVIKLLDIFVGNTAVLFDRDANASRRRETYGLAGEHRRPIAADQRYVGNQVKTVTGTGRRLEYRTLSNFWLRSYKMYSCMFAMGRAALQVALATLPSMYRTPEEQTADMAALQELFDRIDDSQLVKAIQTNDADLARQHWEILATWITTHKQVKPQEPYLKGDDSLDAAYRTSSWAPICQHNVDDWRDVLDRLHKGIIALPLEPQAVLENWPNGDCHGHGWETWLAEVIHPERKARIHLAA